MKSITQIEKMNQDEINGYVSELISDGKFNDRDVQKIENAATISVSSARRELIKRLGFALIYDSNGERVHDNITQYALRFGVSVDEAKEIIIKSGR